MGSLALKTIVFFVFDLFVIFLSTLIWNWYQGYDDILEQSLKFTIYLTILFTIYYYIFEWLWSKNMKI